MLLAILAGLGVGLLLLTWILVHSTTWAGPAVANGLRAVVGPTAVARLEDFVYAAEDRVNRWRRRAEKPRARWTVAPRSSTSPVAATSSTALVFTPIPVGPVHKKWSAPGDGEWVPVPDPRRSTAPPLLYKTLLHPDPVRSWAEVFVVAFSLDAVKLHSAPGTREPGIDTKVPPDFKRTGRVPEKDWDQLLGAFNGGFMTEHGHYGMHVNGVTLVEPRDKACTIAHFRDGTMDVKSWKKLSERRPEMLWFRQTPACMLEDDVFHPGLSYGQGIAWGATLDGDTVIRRSAFGLDKTRRIVLVGITNHTTARALADGMHHAGAVDVAQLDVNWSYPKFLVFGCNPEGGLAGQALMDGFEYSPDDYIKKSSLRDFFYLTRREELPMPTDKGPLCPSSPK